MAKIPTTQGKFAIVDDEDFSFLSRFAWSVDSEGHVSTNFKVKGVWVRIPMSRFLYKPHIGMLPIFVNKDQLDNRKQNIKLVPYSIKNGTSGKMYLRLAKEGKMRRNPSSKYKGVHKISDPRYKRIKFRATIQFQGKVYGKGFENEIDAATWYNKKAKELFGETAYQNNV